MKALQLDISDSFPEEIFDSDSVSEPEIEEAVFSGIPQPESGTARALKICVAVSLILHLAAFMGLPRMMTSAPSKQMVRPEETVTKVRLIEPQPQVTKDEPPPEKPSAISDRNHTAEIERIPKIIPAPQQAPIGKTEPMDQQKLASLPPAAPEDTVDQKEPAPKEPPKTKPGTREKAPDKPKTTKPAETEKKRSSKNHKVDLRPTAEDMAKGLVASGSPDYFPEGNQDEVVVDINTKEDKFFSYLQHLKTKIQGAWVYPSAAARSGLGGSLQLEFAIANSGQLLQVNLLDSSGHTILDESAMKAIKTAAPFFPFPARMKAKRLRIRANFIYVTSSSFFRNML